MATTADEHLERLGKFKRLLPRYQSFNILGAVAVMVILNDEKFKPRAW